MQQSRCNAVSPLDQKRRYYPGLHPSIREDKKIALSLSLWCLLIIGLLFAAMFSGTPAVQTEYNPGASYEPSENVMGLILIMWPLYVSVFLAVFMKQKIAQVLGILLVGCFPAWLMLVFTSLEYLPDPIDMLFFILILIELLMMLASMVYLGNFWTGWFKGISRGPSFKAVFLQLCILVVLLIVFIVTYWQD